VVLDLKNHRINERTSIRTYMEKNSFGRSQRGKQNPYIKKGQTIQCEKKKNKKITNGHLNTT